MDRCVQQLFTELMIGHMILIRIALNVTIRLAWESYFAICWFGPKLPELTIQWDRLHQVIYSKGALIWRALIRNMCQSVKEWFVCIISSSEAHLEHLWGSFGALLWPFWSSQAPLLHFRGFYFICHQWGDITRSLQTVICNDICATCPPPKPTELLAWKVSHIFFTFSVLMWHISNYYTFLHGTKVFSLTHFYLWYFIVIIIVYTYRNASNKRNPRISAHPRISAQPKC